MLIICTIRTDFHMYASMLATLMFTTKTLSFGGKCFGNCFITYIHVV